MNQPHSMALVGWGAQARAWAQNLRDSGWQLSIVLRAQSSSIELVQAEGFSVLEPKDMTSVQVLAVLIPDQAMPQFCHSYQAELSGVKHLVFAHGYSLHFKTADWPKQASWLLVAPKAIGFEVRAAYLEKRPIPLVLSVERDAGGGQALLQDLAQALSGGRGAKVMASAAQEVEADLLSEQALLCGGVPRLLQLTFDVLVEHGISPQVAYLECMHELNVMVQLYQRKGLSSTLKGISPTALFGAARFARNFMGEDFAQRLRQCFANIREGGFTQELNQEVAAASPMSHKYLQSFNKHGLDEAGSSLAHSQIRQGESNEHKV